MSRPPDEGFGHECLRTLTGMLIVAAFLVPPLLIGAGSFSVLRGMLGTPWALAIASALIFLVIPLSMTAAHRLARQYADRWPFA